MRSILIDTGPIIALFNRKNLYHQRIIEFLRGYTGKLITTWPVITEVAHMLDFRVDAQIAFLEWVGRGGVELFDISVEKLNRIIEITRKYQDIPMDLADASLVVVSEETGIREILTIDSDNYIYRTITKEMIRNVLDY